MDAALNPPIVPPIDGAGVLAQWEAAEATRRQTMVRAGVSAPDDVRGLSACPIRPSWTRWTSSWSSCARVGRSSRVGR